MSLATDLNANNTGTYIAKRACCAKAELKFTVGLDAQTLRDLRAMRENKTLQLTNGKEASYSLLTKLALGNLLDNIALAERSGKSEWLEKQKVRLDYLAKTGKKG